MKSRKNRIAIPGFLSVRIETIDTTLTLALKITWGVFIAVWVIGAFTAKRTVRRQSMPSLLAMVAVAAVEYYLLLWAAKYFGIAGRRFVPEQPLYFWIGLLMTIAGVAFAIWARLILGRNWSGIVTVKQNHQLIRTGPYSLVRHPIYTGILFAVFGTVIFDGEIQGVIFILAALPLLIHKMNLEERFMTEQFGPEYASYRRETKALVPFVW